jgi:hypothetical protein
LHQDGCKGNGFAAGDVLEFVGDGFGATFTEIGTTEQWQIIGDAP